MTNYFQAVRQTVKNWYILLIIGILLTIVGVYIFTVPIATYITLSVFFSVSFIISGLLDIIFAIQNSKDLKGWGWYLVNGILTLALGIYLSVYPEISMSILPFVVGFTLLFRSFLLLGYAFDLKELKVVSWGDIALLSVLGILFSFLLIANPFFTGISLVSLTSLSFLFAGITSIAFSFKLKKLKDIPNKISDDLKGRIESLHKELENQINKK
jgi:uncharacterized membrane protein HdeD (DUF308 family)